MIVWFVFVIMFSFLFLLVVCVCNVINDFIGFFLCFGLYLTYRSDFIVALFKVDETHTLGGSADDAKVGNFHADGDA